MYLIEKKKGIKSTSKQPLKDFEDKSKVKSKQTDRGNNKGQNK